MRSRSGRERDGDAWSKCARARSRHAMPAWVITMTHDNASERRDYASIQDLTNLASGVLGTPCEPS